MWFQYNPLHWGIQNVSIKDGSPKGGGVKQVSGEGNASKITASGKVKKVKGTAK